VDEETIFAAALERATPEQRRAFVKEACAGDAKMQALVEGLLKAHDHPDSFLESPGSSLLTGVEHCIHERPGTVIGPYKLLEQIGEGGMGLVFMAEQTQPVRRRVALKIVKPGMETRQVIARFEAERQALALMDHSHIAKVFDAGVTESGRTYFVMELVRGVPITDYCDERRLTTRQRLELFVTVCQAVQHAHHKGVIHRDLKPTNVLVSHHDTVAVPKIIDFGIAKATTQPLTERTLFTHFTQMLGTPLYMSPEQAEMNGLDVDTRSDVYSLGVMLYELLTGTTPFESDTLKKVGLDEMRRMIREEEPPTPSRRLSTLSAQACSTNSERRGVDGRRLGQVLRGELDWIVMKALEKDRDRRYESASAFAADVQRYLNDEAVDACPPSAGYRLRKYVRRNRRVLVPLAVIALVLVAATTVSSWLAAHALNAQRQAEAAESRSATDSAIAVAVNEFLQQDLLIEAVSEPQFGQTTADNPYLTVREALDRAAARIGNRFQDQPLVEAAIRTTIGAAYINLNRHQEASVHLERAVALRQAYLGCDHPDTSDSMRNLAAAYARTDRFPEAISLRQHLLESCEARLGPDDPRALDCLGELAGAFQAAGQWDTSAQLFNRLLNQRRILLGPTHSSTLATMHHLAMCYAQMGRHTESIALHETLLELIQTTNARNHGEVAWLLTTFAITCQRAGKFDRAETLFREALEYCRKRPDSYRARELTATALGFLAQNHFLQQRYAAAEPPVREALSILEKLHPDHPERFYWINLLGGVFCGQERYSEAEPLLLQGYEKCKKRQSLMDCNWRTRLPQAGERVVWFYEVTEQPEKAREWRERLATDKLHRDRAQMQQLKEASKE
jgi:serine/threonine protein kinase